MPIVYIGLGSNLGDREGQVLRAVHEMRSFSRVKKISTLRESEPMGMADQPKFVNAVVEIDTDFNPQEVMVELLRIEAEMGRTREGPKGGPREIDLDLVAYENEVVEKEDLQVPHARMHERRFVLEPLIELNPSWVHPKLQASAVQLLSKLPPDRD
ncbi:MAG TPA: 2-amino-4-hydroxy-6-hydroxymethyldihydropteridine diphosphokinase [Bdellovibrionota bacterium]|nr:2-amino-4-hydroxy-6-hydroxymethyldihydropteridine diphosphokinase [Bdellovibrionota bacterium]